MNLRRASQMIPLFAMALVLLLPPGRAGAVDGTSLRRRQLDQQRARIMARELIDTILAVQLQQLEENGLTDLPIYRDIRTMRASIGELVETEMNSVVAILAAAQQA
ncbi:MAG: hypothetical protein KDA79_07030, partial [Planctomycetaceae bacterium]|nr:hypothetical protein [Planctomycetaceae bacterium]